MTGRNAPTNIPQWANADAEIKFPSAAEIPKQSKVLRPGIAGNIALHVFPAARISVNRILISQLNLFVFSPIVFKMRT